MLHATTPAHGSALLAVSSRKRFSRRKTPQWTKDSLIIGPSSRFSCNPLHDNDTKHKSQPDHDVVMTSSVAALKLGLEPRVFSLGTTFLSVLASAAGDSAADASFNIESTFDEAMTIVTPRASSLRVDAKTPPNAPIPQEHPALLKALIQRSPAAVRSVLEWEPEAATMPFWDHSVEPPLCAAIRLRCAPEIVELLLKSGADAHLADVHSRTPMMLLRSIVKTAKCGLRSVFDFDCEATVQLLLDAGAEGVPKTDTAIPTNDLESDPWYVPIADDAFDTGPLLSNYKQQRFGFPSLFDFDLSPPDALVSLPVPGRCPNL